MKKIKFSIWLPTVGACLTVLAAFFLIVGSEPVNRQAMTEKNSDPYKTVLLAGVDDAGENTDMLLLCSFDKDKGSLHVMQIPRDTYFRTQDGTGKINRLFRSYTSKYGKKHAAEMFSDTISQALGVEIDGYVIFGGKTVEELVDLLGGVSVNVPLAFSYYDKETGKEKRIDAGINTLRGAEALAFVRHRKSYTEGDIGRLDAQMRFLSGMTQALPRFKKLSTLMTIYQEILPNLLTNLKEKDIMEVMMAYFKKRKDFSVRLSRLPGEACYADGHWYYVLSRVAAERLLSDAFGADVPFDTKKRFTDERKEAIKNIYTHSDTSYRIYTPEEAGDKKVLG